MAPTASLAIPVYNGEEFIAEAIRSILNQDYQDLELIITDNASTDGTERICREFAASDGRIRYIRNERNLGAGPNHNLGFELSSGKYFKWCACDDYLSPNFVGSCVSALENNQDAVIAQGTVQSVDHDGRPIPLIGSKLSNLEGLGPARRFQTVIATGQSMCYELLGVCRRDALKKTKLHGAYYGSDHPLLCEMALLGTFLHVPDIVFYNRDHAMRSMKQSQAERTVWQYANAKTYHSFVHIHRLANLLEVAIRHRRFASPFETLPIVLASELRPFKLSQYILDLLSFGSPLTRSWLRGVGWAILLRLNLQPK
jgi:glycosyltransferase involved in cell wall biosynthesis